MYERPVILTTRTGQKIAGIAREESLFGVDWLVLNAYDLDAARVTGNSESFDVYFNPDDVSSFAEVDGKVIKPFSENNPYRPASQRDLFEHGRPMPEHEAGHRSAAQDGPQTPEGMKSFLEDILGGGRDGAHRSRRRAGHPGPKPGRRADLQLPELHRQASRRGAVRDRQVQCRVRRPRIQSPARRLRLPGLRPSPIREGRGGRPRVRPVDGPRR